jgi:hypothetical protein
MSEKRKSETGIYRMSFVSEFYGLFRPLLFIMTMILFAGCAKDDNQTGLEPDPLRAIGIEEIIPADLADSVVVDPVVSVTFKAGTDPSKLAATVITLKKEGSSVPGKTKISGTSAIFTPEADLAPDTEYTATIKTSDGGSNSSDTHEYSWRFRTGRHHHNGYLTVLTTDPLNEATSVPVTTSLTVTFNTELTSAMKASTLIMLKKGLTSVEGTVSFSGSTATFKPAVNLTPRTIYSGRVKMGTSDPSDDDKSGDSYYWSFTTGGENTDVTAPKVLSTDPANNATSVAISAKAAVSFSMLMNPATINSSTFTLKQGSAAVEGIVSYSGTTATFTPSAALAGNTVYTGTITTGVQDTEGNNLAADYSWSFTTIETPVLLSFASDVVPVLNLCNNCHTHPWTTSSNASTFYTNLVNGGYVNPSSPTTGKIYTKISGGHPGSGISTADKNKILDWMTQGSINN